MDTRIVGVTADGKAFIEDALPTGLQRRHWILCYDSRTDCTSHASCFHSKCDAHAETLVLGHNSLGYTFGGFAQSNWEGGGEWATAATGDFIFKLGPGMATVYRPTGANSEYQYQDSEV